MKLRILLVLAVALMLIGLAPGKKRKLVSQSDQDVIRVTVGLVQVDAVVTDSKGKHVADLKPEDFEVTQDGKPQKITHFTFVSTTSPRPAAAPQPVRTATKSKIPVPPPPTRVKPNQVQRTMAFVVDDLGLSFESIAYVRKALQKFVDTQMQPGDLVAVVRTGAGMGALQAFTQDPRVLKAAIDHVKWNPMGRVGVSSFAPIGSEEGSIAETEFYNRIYSVGTLGAINYIVTGLKELPGRKSIILFTESMRMFNRDSSTDQVYDAMLSLADEANRASTVIYTIDPRGLPTLQLTAADRVTDTRPDRMAEQQMQRTQQHWESQEGMATWPTRPAACSSTTPTTSAEASGRLSMIRSVITLSAGAPAAMSSRTPTPRKPRSFPQVPQDPHSRKARAGSRFARGTVITAGRTPTSGRRTARATNSCSGAAIAVRLQRYPGAPDGPVLQQRQGGILRLFAVAHRREET